MDCLLAGGAKADFEDRVRMELCIYFIYFNIGLIILVHFIQLNQTALHKACERGHVDVAKSLLALGPEVG